MLLACALLGVIFIFIKFLLWRRKYLLLPGTKPRFYNVFGDILKFDLSKNFDLQLMKVFEEQAKLFQKENFFCLWLSYTPFVILHRADAVKEVFKTHKIIDKGWMYKFVELIGGKGIVTSPAEKWKFRRKLIMPCFNLNVLRSFLPIYNERSQNLVDSLRGETKKEFVEIIDFTTSCALDIMCDTILDVTPEIFRKENFQYMKLMKRLERLFGKVVVIASYVPYFILMKTKTGREAIHNANVMKETTRSMITEKKKRYLNGERKSHSGNHKSVMDLLLELHIETGYLDEEGVQEEVDTFAIAAHETVANAAMWAFYLIGLNPEVQAKMHNEIDQIFGVDLERHITERDLTDLPYLDCVLKECLRVYTTAPMYIREIKEDTNICGYNIPKGTNCIICSYILHKDEDVFPNPEKFDPDRFSPENRTNIPDCAYIPFSAGPRNCIGFKFAEMELKIMICSVLRNYTLESLDARDEIVAIMSLTLTPLNPIRIRIRPRSFNNSIPMI